MSGIGTAYYNKTQNLKDNLTVLMQGSKFNAISDGSNFFHIEVLILLLAQCIILSSSGRGISFVKFRLMSFRVKKQFLTGRTAFIFKL